mmetsp:Transcript_20952/g.52651  ORF Transcript_20952/g.52651 Transcript_20952/m.52651 type:complete len:363 (-) Transcript_20952:197-1285(-)
MGVVLGLIQSHKGIGWRFGIDLRAYWVHDLTVALEPLLFAAPHPLDNFGIARQQKCHSVTNHSLLRDHLSSPKRRNLEPIAHPEHLFLEKPAEGRDGLEKVVLSVPLSHLHRQNVLIVLCLGHPKYHTGLFDNDSVRVLGALPDLLRTKRVARDKDVGCGACCLLVCTLLQSLLRRELQVEADCAANVEANTPLIRVSFIPRVRLELHVEGVELVHPDLELVDRHRRQPQEVVVTPSVVVPHLHFDTVRVVRHLHLDGAVPYGVERLPDALSHLLGGPNLDRDKRIRSASRVGGCDAARLHNVGHDNHLLPMLRLTQLLIAQSLPLKDAAPLQNAVETVPQLLFPHNNPARNKVVAHVGYAG